MPAGVSPEVWLHEGLGQHPVFGSLPEAARLGLISAGAVLEYASAERILAEGTPARTVYVLLKGSVRVFHRSASGREVLLKRFSPPAIFGEMECLTGIAYMEHAEAMERSVVLSIPGSLFETTVADNPPCAVALLKDVCARLCIAAQNEKMLAFYSVRARLAHFLLSQALFDGLTTYEGLRARVPFNQDDMALALAVTRRAVAKEISRWHAENVIARHGAHYVIVDRERLETEAQDLRLGLTYRIGATVDLSERKTQRLRSVR